MTKTNILIVKGKNVTNIYFFHNVGSKLIFSLARAHHCVKLFIVNLSITIQVSFINHDLEREHFEKWKLRCEQLCALAKFAIEHIFSWTILGWHKERNRILRTGKSSCILMSTMELFS
jgi:hypothetical protein